MLNLNSNSKLFQLACHSAEKRCAEAEAAARQMHAMCATKLAELCEQNQLHLYARVKILRLEIIIFYLTSMCSSLEAWVRPLAARAQASLRLSQSSIPNHSTRSADVSIANAFFSQANATKEQIGDSLHSPSTAAPSFHSASVPHWKVLPLPSHAPDWANTLHEVVLGWESCAALLASDHNSHSRSLIAHESASVQYKTMMVQLCAKHDEEIQRLRVRAAEARAKMESACDARV